MATTRRPSTPRRPRGQRGISLAVSLVLLVVVTLLALGSMRGVVLQSRMSGSTHDRNLAFQAAEVALREAERRAATVGEAELPSAGCNAAGYCATPAITDTPRWLDAGFAGWRQATSAVPADVAEPPEAIVEDMGETASAWPGCENESPPQPNCIKRRYVVTARSAAPGRAAVVVQSQFAAP